MPWPTPTDPPVPFQEAGSGAPVLMVHGRLNNAGLWEATATYLSRRFRAIRCDLRLGGRLADPTADLLLLLDWLSLSRVHLVSHGAGWSWASGLAVQCPQRVASLTVVDPVVPRVERDNAVQEAWHLEMLLQWLSVSYGSVVRRPEHATALAAAVAQQTHAQMGGAVATGSPFATGENADLPPLKGVHCPLLALIGQGAPTESKSLVASVFGQVPQACISQVAGANRHSPLEAPAVLAELIERFLASLPC